MRILSSLRRHDLKRRVQKALSSAQFVVETVGSAEECSYSTLPGARTAMVSLSIPIRLTSKTLWI
jgi:hypothetical protein